VDERIGLMGHMVGDLIVGICQIEMKQLGMVGSWILQTGGVSEL